ncbi:MAG: AmmeMemoRadiSam system protein A [Bacilli bacterium]
MSIIAGFMVPHPPIIIPEVGRGEEKKASATISAYLKVAKEISKLKPDTIIITSPHAEAYLDYFQIDGDKKFESDLSVFNARNVKFSIYNDLDFINELVKECKNNKISAGTEGRKYDVIDHGSMVPLYFINKNYSNYKLVRIGLSGFSLLDHYKLGMLIKEVSEKQNKKIVFVASGDLSHCQKEDGPYGFKEEGPIYDKQIMEVMSHGNFDKIFCFDYDFLEKAEECGHKSFVIMAGAFNKMGVASMQLSHEAPFGVGYGVCSFYPKGIDESRDFYSLVRKKEDEAYMRRLKNEDEYCRLARLSLESYIKENRVIDISNDLSSELLNKKAGVFVSLKKFGELRGCIGTIEATKSSIAKEIIDNAIEASTRDPRFNQVLESELKDLVYSVDVLGPISKIKNKDELDVKRYGVIVKNGYKQGLLLPNLEGVDTIDEQISIAKRKAGIGKYDNVELFRFEVIRHK